MAHFYGTVKGNRGQASRLGTKASGLKVTADGWTLGGMMTMYQDSEGNDHIDFFLDGGSGGSVNKVLAQFVVKDDHIINRATGAVETF